jgi:hypothetical protein
MQMSAHEVRVSLAGEGVAGGAAGGTLDKDEGEGEGEGRWGAGAMPTCLADYLADRNNH